MKNIKYVAGQVGIHLLCFLLYLLLWVVATPMTFFLLKGKSRIIRWVVNFILLILVFMFSGFISFWLFSIPILCVELADLVQSNSKIRLNYAKQLVLLGAFIAAHLAIYFIYRLVMPGEIEGFIQLWQERADMYLNNLSQQLGSETSQYKGFQKALETAGQYIPAIYIGSFILGYFTCFWNSALIKKFKMPDIFFWLTILSFGVGFLSFDSLGWPNLNEYKIYFKNIFAIFACLYFFQGFAVFGHLMQKLKIARFWQNLWYILIIFNLPVGLVFIGLIDFIFEFRSKSKEVKK